MQGNGTRAWFRIDFNRLLSNTIEYSSYGTSTFIKMEGEAGAVQFYSPISNATPVSVLATLRLQFDGNKVQPQRVVNAFAYFIKTYCPGKGSAF